MRLAWILVVAACHHAEPPSLPPSAPWTCAAAAEHVRQLIGPERPRAARIGEVVAASCTADGWSDEVRACVVTTVSLRKPQHCKALLTVDQRIAFETALAAATTRQLRKACADYQALLDRLGSCPAITTAVRGALFDAYRKAQRDWTRSGSSDESALADRCRALTHDVTRMVAKPCRW